MTTNVIMPQLGESVVEGTVVAWLKKVGDSVAEYEPLLEVSTDKVTSEIPAPASGTLLEIFVSEDETVQAGTLLCIIGEAGSEDIRATLQGENGHAAKPLPILRHSAPQGKPAQESRPIRLSPVVARMVAEHGLDVAQIRGTGEHGRVTKKDVEAYLQQDQPAAETPPWEQPGTGDLFKPTETPQAAPTQTPPPRAIPIEAIPQASTGELLKLTPIRRAIAEHMVHSKLQTAPHVTTVFEADMTHVLAHMAVHKPTFAKQGVNLTLTAYFVAAMVVASQEYPILNSRWTDEGILLNHAVHVGMAVAVSDGLLVPVIKNADSLNLLGLARQVNDLATRARQAKLKPDEVSGGTITLTNHGVSGSLFATPIINQPQSAILGVGLMEKRVKVIDDAIAIRPCCYISLTFDHRVADGATADGWLMRVKRFLEEHPAS